MVPASDPGIPGEMAFQSVSGELRAMYAERNPVFSWGCGLPVESHTSGWVKTLYR